MPKADPLTTIAIYGILIAFALIASNAGQLSLLLGVPFLASIFANLMMLHIGVSAALGRFSPRWALLPILTYAVWAAAVAYNWSATNRAIERLGLQGWIEVSNADNSDLLFAKDDHLGLAARRYLVGGRIFSGEDEIQVFRVDDPMACDKDPTLLKYGRYSGGIFGGPYQVFNDCFYSRTETGSLRGLVVTGVEVARPADWAGGRIFTYDIKQQGMGGETRRVGQFSAGTTQRWSPFPIFTVGRYSSEGRELANSNWYWLDPVRRQYYFATTRENRLLYGDDGSVHDRDKVAVQALAALLGRNTRIAAPKPPS